MVGNTPSFQNQTEPNMAALKTEVVIEKDDNSEIERADEIEDEAAPTDETKKKKKKKKKKTGRSNFVL